ncbi:MULTISPECIES: hypothetical protein [Rhizobium]|uniref:hypothetical protein n=1 Tax=Rhizobium TaxID=379 RepID=UPI0013DF2693|nr:MULTISPECIES: hypothetical protein [Rhizobium]NEJ96247.1 hypothetical protein [Rhizobium ruizarguesonis]WSH72190.1 hypothetical protein U8Q02_01235 [Rhizobium leguminosarum]
MTMHINSKRIEIELYRDSLWLRLSFFGWTFQTFRDFSGRGTSATDWIKHGAQAGTGASPSLRL